MKINDVLEKIEDKISELESKYKRKYGYRCSAAKCLRELEDYISDLYLGD